MENKEQLNLTAKQFIQNHKLTTKAEFLYVNGFVGEITQVEKMDVNLKNVTFKNGFKGFDVYISNENKLFIAKAESEEGNIYSYQVIELEEITEEEYKYLIGVKKEVNIINIPNVMKYFTLVISMIGFVLTIISLVTYMMNGETIISALIMSSLTLLFAGMLAGLSGLLFKK